ncbi:MAG: DUF2339 domain-containing protein [Patescibacteria group bacterium]
MGVFLFICGMIVLIVLLDLRRRVRKLEALTRQWGASPIASQPPTAVTTQVSPMSPTTGAPSPAVRPALSAEPSSDLLHKFAVWLKDDWLLKLGAFLILIGFGWLVTYAFLHDWIGPMGRITLGMVAGTLILMFGWWRIRTFLHQGSVFLVLGSTTILVTLFAAREVYDFFTPFTVLAVMFLSTAFVAMASVRFRTPALSLLSLALAGVAPLLTRMPKPDYPALFLYLLVVVLGALWIVVLTRRRELTTAALVLITFYSMPHFLASASLPDQDVLLIFAYAFAAVFFIANTLGVLKSQEQGIEVDLVTAAGSGMLLLAWIVHAAQDEWKSLIIAAWMIVYTVGAFAIFRITRRRQPMYVYACVAIVMLAAATAVELEGAALMITYTVECSIISLLAYLILRDLSIAERLSCLLIGPALFSYKNIFSRAWKTGVIHEDFFVLLVLAMALSFLGSFFWLKGRERGAGHISDYNLILLVAGSAYAYLLMWRSFHAVLADGDVASMIALVGYTIIGLSVYIYGRTHEVKIPRIYGAVLLGIVVGRLLIVEVWSMELTGRIITFFLVGALLVSTAFLGRKKASPTT